MGVIERIQAVASIEQLEAEQLSLGEQIESLQKQSDAVGEFLRILLIARDGKPKKKTRQLATTAEPVTDDGRDGDEDGIDETLQGSPTLTANQQAVLGLLRRGAPQTIGEITRIIKVPYGTVYTGVQKMIAQNLVVKLGDKIAIKA